MLREHLIRKHHVQIVGNPDAAQTLLFVHGFGTDQSTWAKIVPAFESSHRIVLFDNVGAGQSDPEAFVQHRYLGLASYAEDLVTLAAGLDLMQTTVIGHSVGGMIAALAASETPHHFARLVMMSTSPRYLDADDGYYGGFTQADLQRTYSAVLSNFSDWVTDFAPRAVNAPDKPEIARHFADTLHRIPPEHALTVLCAILQSDHRADLPRIGVPTLIIQSRDDFFVPPEVAEYLQQHIRHSRLANIDARGHFPHLTAPDQVIAALRGFV